MNDTLIQQAVTRWQNSRGALIAARERQQQANASLSSLRGSIAAAEENARNALTDLRKQERMAEEAREHLASVMQRDTAARDKNR